MTEVIANSKDWDKTSCCHLMSIGLYHGLVYFPHGFVYAPHTGLLLCKYTYTLLTCAIIFGPCMGKIVHLQRGLCKTQLIV